MAGDGSLGVLRARANLPKSLRPQVIAASSMNLNSILRWVFAGLVLSLTGIALFVTTQAVLAQPLDHATATISLF